MKFSIGIQSDTFQQDFLLGQILTDIFNKEFILNYEKQFKVIYITVIFISDPNNDFLKDFYKPRPIKFLRNELSLEIEFQSNFDEFVNIKNKEKKLTFLLEEIKKHLFKIKKNNKKIQTKIDNNFFEDLKKFKI